MPEYEYIRIESSESFYTNWCNQVQICYKHHFHIFNFNERYVTREILSCNDIIGRIEDSKARKYYIYLCSEEPILSIAEEIVVKQYMISKMKRITWI